MQNPLAKQILLLNRLWQPVNFIGVKRAMSFLFQENASVILTDNQSYQLMGVMNG